MSMSIVNLSADLTSFYDLQDGEALEKLRSGLVGEAEPLRVLGVMLTEDRVKLKAMEMGLWDGTGALSEGAKMLARYQIILQDTSKAHGDFKNTADGLANSTRTMTKSFADLQAELGEKLLPLANIIVGALNGLLDWFNNLGDTGKTIAVIVGGLLALVGPVLKLIVLIGNVSAMFGAGGALAGAGAALSAAFSGAFSAILAGLAAITAPVWILIAAIAALALVWNKFGAQATNTLSMIGQMIVAVGQRAWYEMGAAAEQAGVNTRVALEGMAADTDGAMAQIMATIQDTWARATTSAQQLGQIMRAVWQRAVSDVRSALSQIWSNFTTWASSLTSKFYAVGKGIVDGIWKGISGGWEWLKGQISTNMDSLLQWVKDILGIASPSKVFASQVGLPMAQGIGAGFTGGMARLAPAMTSAPGMAPASYNTQRYSVGRIEYHGAFSDAEKRRLNAQQRDNTMTALKDILE